MISERLNVPWLEYWDFLDTYCNFKTIDGLKLFEIFLMQKKLLALTEQQLRHLAELRESDASVQVAANILAAFLSTNMGFDWLDHTLGAKFKAHKLNDGRDDDADTSSQLNTYLDLVCQLTRLDNSGRAYFGLYKRSELYVKLISNTSNYFGLHDPYAGTFLRRFCRCSQGALVVDEGHDTSIKELNDNEKFFSDRNVDHVEFLCFKFSNLTIRGDEFVVSRRSLARPKGHRQPTKGVQCQTRSLAIYG